MTNKEAIEIVEDIGFYVSLLDSQREALDRLVQIARDYDALMNMTCVKISKEDEEKIIDKLNEIGNIGYMVSAEDMHKALERENDRGTD